MDGMDIASTAPDTNQAQQRLFTFDDRLTTAAGKPPSPAPPPLRRISRRYHQTAEPYLPALTDLPAWRLTNDIAYHRARRQMPQAELARLANVSWQTVNRIERGRQEPLISLALVMAGALATDVADVFHIELSSTAKPDQPRSQRQPHICGRHHPS